MSWFNPDKNILFIHIPGTAGTSMEHAPFLGGGGHMRALDYRALDRSAFESAFKFAFARDPADRIVSKFFHSGLKLHKYSLNKEGFKEFVHEMGERGLEPNTMYPEPGHAWIHHHFLPQWFFVSDDNDELLIDFVGRYEQLQHDWGVVCETIGINFVLPHLREGNHESYNEYHDTETLAIIRRVYARDYELFKY